MEMANAAPIDAIEAIPGLYISNITVPYSRDVLREHGITHVISLTSKRDCPKFDQTMDIEHIHIENNDNPLEDLLMCLEGLCAWIENALCSNVQMEETGSKETPQEFPGINQERRSTEKPDVETTETPKREPRVLVHCVQGISRSGAIVTAYLMRKLSLDYETALALARKSRAVIAPNSGFADQIRLWQQLHYCILSHAPDENGGDLATKDEYENWRSDRGVLLSRVEQEKQAELMRRMADLAARYRARK